MPPEAPDSWVELIQLDDISRPGGYLRVPDSKPRMRRLRKILLRFLFLIVIPTGLTIFYFGFVAADRFVSEATFVVRQPGMPNRLGAQVISTDNTPTAASGEDSYAVNDYVMSRDAMHLLVDQADLKAILARAGHDWVWRFPSPLHANNDEALYRLYQSLVSVNFESSTGLTVLRTQGFRPDDAQRLAQVLMQGAEALLNRLNARARRDAVAVAQDEVARARAAATRSEAAVTAFRVRTGIADPLAQAKQMLETIGSLTMDKVATATQLDIAMQAAPNSPQIAPLRSRIRALQAQIAEEKASLAGTGSNFTPYLEEFERLLLRREFDQKTYLAMLAGLQSAEMDTRRQQSFLEAVVSPGKADRATYPWRASWIAAVLLSGLATFLLALPPRVQAMRAVGRDV